ncbi:MAG: diguanylate cyclase [Gammaproteobacteria bacterium]
MNTSKADRYKILIIDDNPVNIRMLGTILEHEYAIAASTSAADAFEYLKTHEPPDLILLDIMMPVMNGHQFYNQLKINPETADIPVIFVTAHGEEQAEVDSMTLGAVDFLSKPVSPNIVEARVRNHLLRYKQKQQIAAHEALLTALFEATNDALLVFDTGNRLSKINYRTENYWPRLGEDCLGMDITEIAACYFDPHLDESEADKTKFIAALRLNKNKEGMIKLKEEKYYRYYLAPLYRDKVYIGKLLCFADLTSEKRIQLDLRSKAITDELTGLYNRRYMIKIIQRELNTATRYGYEMGLIMVDIDFFKHINDTYGHIYGDRVLATVAAELRKHFRNVDYCFRYGGEEFAILMPNVNKKGLKEACERLRQEISKLNIDKIRLTVSIGAATNFDLMKTHSENCPNNLIQLADNYLYKAKNQGRNQVCLID